LSKQYFIIRQEDYVRDLGFPEGHTANINLFNDRALSIFCTEVDELEVLVKFKNQRNGILLGRSNRSTKNDFFFALLISKNFENVAYTSFGKVSACLQV
jgi:hypothetical protein